MTDPLRGLPPAEGRADERAMSGVGPAGGQADHRSAVAGGPLADRRSSMPRLRGPRSAFAVLRDPENDFSGKPLTRSRFASRNAPRFDFPTDAGWSSQVARRAHNPKVAGSNPAPATSLGVPDPAVLDQGSGVGVFQRHANRVPVGSGLHQDGVHDALEQCLALLRVFQRRRWRCARPRPGRRPGSSRGARARPSPRAQPARAPRGRSAAWPPRPAAWLPAARSSRSGRAPR